MKRLLILGESMPIGARPNYRGLYRSSVIPFPNMDQRIMSYVLEYINHSYNIPIGVSLEDFDLRKLREITDYYRQYQDSRYELIYYSNDFVETADLFFGIDVTGIGGYSLMGSNEFWRNPFDSKANPLLRRIRDAYAGKQNEYELFSERSDAEGLSNILNENDGVFESGEVWRPTYIYKAY